MEERLSDLPDVLKLAAHEVRWHILQLLAHSDYRVHDLVKKLGIPQNLLSYHLKQLRQGQLITERRSSVDERSLFYTLELERFQQLYRQAGEVLHPALTVADSYRPIQREKYASLSVLFLCTENSARSQMAEALLRHLSHDTIAVASAGSVPAFQVHPLARSCMEELGIDMSSASPRHLKQFLGQKFTAIITVCDRALETCPSFPGDPDLIHWSLLDPASVRGTEAVQREAFTHTSKQLTTRIHFLLPFLTRKKFEYSEP